MVPLRCFDPASHDPKASAIHIMLPPKALYCSSRKHINNYVLTPIVIDEVVATEIIVQTTTIDTKTWYTKKRVRFKHVSIIQSQLSLITVQDTSNSHEPLFSIKSPELPRYSSLFILYLHMHVYFIMMLLSIVTPKIHLKFKYNTNILLNFMATWENVAQMLYYL